MSWIAILSLITTLLLGGGVGLGYASDGAVPGDVLYGLDTAIESIEYSLTLNPESRAQLAMANAEERMTELQELIDKGAPEAEVQEAVDGYGQNISQAAEALAAMVASGDDDASAEYISTLLQEALSVHTEVLIGVQDQAPDQAKSSIDLAIGSSEAGQIIVEGIFSEGMPGDHPEGEPVVPSGELPELVPGGPSGDVGPPEELPGAPEGAAPADPVGDDDSRIASLGQNIEDIQQLVHSGSHDELQDAVVEYENEVDLLAQALAEIAMDDEARAQALAVLLDEALAQHSKVLNEVLGSAPDQAKASIEQAIAASEVVMDMMSDIFSGGFPGGGAPEGAPTSGIGSGRP